MNIILRLAQIVNYEAQQKSGIVRDIADYTGVDRHYITALLRGRAKSIRIENLEKICQFLIDKQYATAEELPALLFGRDTGQFLDMFRDYDDYLFSVGMRERPKQESQESKKHPWPERRWVSASDAHLQAVLLHSIYGPNVHRDTVVSSNDDSQIVLQTRASGGENHPLRAQLTASLEAPSRRQSIQQHIVEFPNTGKQMAAMLKKNAAVVYDQYKETDKQSRRKALIVLGSLKSNAVAELVFGEVFSADPFMPQDDVTTANKRSVPIFYRYRDQDAQPPSCCGGLKLFRSARTKVAGIYYEDANRKWKHIASNNKTDAALVFYVNRPLQGRLEMVLGGFSGRATSYLAKYWHLLTDKLWPPAYVTPELQVGAFVVKMEYKQPKKGGEPIHRYDAELAGYEAISLELPALERRLPSTNTIEEDD